MTVAARAPLHDLAVCGGGISGLALAYLAGTRGVPDVVVLEGAGRPGGKIQTEWVDGFCCEWGPQGFLDNVPETLALVASLGLSDELVRADDGAGDRFIARDGRLRQVPLSPPAFLTSDVLSLPGRLRVLLEPFQRRGEEEESVFAFASRRIGREAAEVLVDAMVTGVYAGDPARLSLPATFPKMRAMEREYGSLVRAMLARRKSGGGGPAGPGGTLTTLRLGMQQLTDALASALGAGVRLGAPVERITRGAGSFAVRLGDGSELAAKQVAVAMPPGAAARALAALLPEGAVAALQGIPYAKVAVVMTGYRAPHPFAHSTRGFGFLVPGRERRRILGSIFCDATFPAQAPAGATLLRTLLGGARDPGALDLPDGELLALLRRELDHFLGGDPDPDFVRVIRHDYGIPQYTLGHLARLDEIERAAAAIPGLHLLGNGFHGIAANACVIEAEKSAALVAGAA